MLILSENCKSIKALKDWAKEKGATDLFISHAKIYFDICSKVGVNASVAYCQYAKETGYGKYGGVLNETFKNPCGLKGSNGGACDDPQAHKRFDSWEKGIQAHIDHLALYAGHNNYPKADSPDPRHFNWLHGKCPTVKSLGGNWATSTTYGDDIVRMVEGIKETSKSIDILINDDVDSILVKSDKITLFFK